MKRAGKSPYELAVAMGLVGAMDSAAAAGRDHSLHLKKALRNKRRARLRERRALREVR